MATINCTVQRDTWYQMYIEYSYTQDVLTNQSVISHALKLKQLTDSYDFNSKMTIQYSVAGEVFSFSDTVNIDDKGNKGYTITIMSGTTTVNHSNDGTRSVDFSCSGSCNSGGWGPGKINLNTTTVTLNTIPRASLITKASSVILGESCDIEWIPASTSFSYKLKFVLNNWSYTTEPIHPNQTDTYTYTSYTLPIEVAYQLPNSVNGTMSAYLYTYSDSGCETQIGSMTNKTFTVTVPDTVIPTLDSVSATIVNDNSVINGWGVAVAGYTKVNITAEANGSYGSTISGYVIGDSYEATQNGETLSYTGSIINSSGNKQFSVVAKDSRGRISQSSTILQITFYPYSPPKISSFSVARNSNNAKQVVVKATWDYSSVNENNISTATLYYKKTTSSNWVEYGEILENTSTVLTSEFEEKSSYNFKIVVGDSLSETTQEEGFISTIEVTMDFRAGGKGIGIGKMSESDNLEIAFDTIFMGNIYIQINSSTKMLLSDYIKSLIG